MEAVDCTCGGAYATISVCIFCLISLLFFGAGRIVFGSIIGMALWWWTMEAGVLIASGQYEQIQTLRDEQGSVSGYAAGIAEEGITKYAILSARGIQMTPFLYTSVRAAGDDFICSTGSKYRIVLSIGVESRGEYSSVAYAGGGVFFTLTGNVNDDIADSLSIIGQGGAVRSSGISVMYGLSAFSDGLMPLCEGGSMRFGLRQQGRNLDDLPDLRIRGATSRADTPRFRPFYGFGMIDRSGVAQVDIVYDFFERGDGIAIGDADGVMTVFSIGKDGIEKSFEYLLERRFAAYQRAKRGDLRDGRRACGGRRRRGNGSRSLPTASVSEAGGLYVVRDGGLGRRKARTSQTRTGKTISSGYNTIRILDGTGKRRPCSPMG